MRDITIGQFFPGNSLLHKIDPRFKIILTILFIVIVFSAKSYASYLALTIFLLSLVFLSGISFKIIAKSLRSLVFILIFTSALNIFWTTGENLVFGFGFIKVYKEGLIFALLMVIRITVLLCGTTVILTYTTSPIMLTDGLERLLSPFKMIGLPVHEFSLMMSIALRFIPTLVEETDKIMSAQKSRGADFESGNIFARTKALIPILIPLFVSSFKRADELATAMECRCYHGGRGRTKMNVPKIHAIDIVSLISFVFAYIIILVLNYYFA